jgi:hypothetical protein
LAQQQENLRDRKRERLYQELKASRLETVAEGAQIAIAEQNAPPQS